jgi:hypothetical protein
MIDFTSLLSNYQITADILLYLLYIPIIATIVNAARYLVGMKMYGLYAPTLLAFAYIFTGIRFGLLITIAVILSTLLTYFVLRKIRMHYLSRIAINYTVISFSILGIIVLNELSPISMTSANHALTVATPLGIVIIATLSDFFIKQYVKKSFISTIRALAETVAVAVVGWWLLSLGWDDNFQISAFGTFLLTGVWIYPVLIIVNILIGQYSGLRFKDISRFKRVWQN